MGVINGQEKKEFSKNLRNFFMNFQELGKKLVSGISKTFRLS
jgi:hypothetical protein